MDSLTQIVLGAGVGEAVLGKKIGNRAMLWGAVGGTIPDLDVLGGLLLSEINNLAFHRGISHSIFFSIVGAIILGWLVHGLYNSLYHKWVAIVSKVLAAILIVLAANFVLRIFFPDNLLPLILVCILLAMVLLFHLRKKYFTNNWVAPNATVRNWQWLFFLSLFTHPLLDIFTTYGTQLFAPFSNYRVAFNTVSVLDPMYTAPFIICLVTASFLHRTSSWRRVWNYFGLGVSTAYLLFTVINKYYINQVFENAFAHQHITVQRYTTSPTILNNILWSATAETDSAFYLGQYSWFDEVPITFHKIEKGHQLLKNIDTDPTLKTLRWFSNDYYSVMDLDSALQYNDLRFGTFYGTGDKPEDFIFYFHLIDQGTDGYFMKKGHQGPRNGGANKLFGDLITRIKGLKQ